MKKAIVIALVLVLALSVALFAACGYPEQTVEGEFKLENAWVAGTYYGVKVKVTVKGNKITAVEMLDDSVTGWTSTSPTWAENASEGDLGAAKAKEAYADYIKNTFVGKSIKVVNAYDVAAENVTDAEGKTKSVYTCDKDASYNLKGATQSAVRIILAVQNALTKLAK